jgi:N-methylhydantoinase B
MNIPVEVVESTTLLRINYFRIRRDSGGAGRYRGGCGFEKEYECLCDRVIVSHRGERHYTQPWGLEGGQPGASSRSVIVRANGVEEVVPSKMTIELRKHDRLVLWTSGGGGYGNSFDRPADAVCEDVLNKKVSVEAAAAAYGVAIAAGKIDLEKTTTLRKARIPTAA